MNKNKISRVDKMKNNSIKSQVININAVNSIKLQAYKKALIDKAIEEIKKIEEDIINLEKNKI